MKICVCVKQVPASNETQLDPVTHTIMREGNPSILNPFDAYAVEEALRLKERCGGRITAVSMGPAGAEETLRRVLALGADEALLLTDRAFAGSDTLATARTLAAAIRRFVRPDVVLCGRMATDGDTAQVGPMLARLMGFTPLCDVASFESVTRLSVTARRQTDDGYAVFTAPAPVVATVTKEINVPRLPSVLGILRAEKMTVRKLSLADIGLKPEETGLKGSMTRVISTERPERKRACRLLSGTPGEQAQALLTALKDSRLLAEGRQTHGE